MLNQIPVAVVNGIEKFGAKQVAELLVENDIRVIGVGEYNGGWSDLKNFEIKDGLEEIEGEADYWFDLRGEKEVWKRAEKEKSRLTIIGVNKPAITSGELIGSDVNWRVVNVHGVYGEGMDEGEIKEIGYLIKAIRLAVANKNLVLPKRNKKLRLVALSDFREAVFKASFLSGTEKETFEIWGREINCEDLAKVLIEEGKMTRFKVEEEEVKLEIPDDEKVSKDWRKIRWQPVVELGEGMRETMQYFFSKTDEENRKKKSNPIQTPQRPMAVTPLEKRGPEQKKENIKRFEVMVEEEKPPEDFGKMPDDGKKKNIVKAEVVEKTKEPEDEPEEAFEEIRPLIVKNSNVRPVGQIPPTPPSFGKGGQEHVTERFVKEKSKFGLGKYWQLGVLWIGVVVLLAIVILGWKSYQVFAGIGKIEKLITERKFPEATQLINKSLSLAKSEDAVIESWEINKWIWGRRYQSVLKAMEEGLVVGNKAVDLSQRAETINGAIFNDQTIDWQSELTGLKKNLEESSDQLGILQARLSGDWSWVPEKWRGKLTAVKQQLNEVSNLVALGKKAVEILPTVLGTDGKKREFMVLLQNENELRAGGGFLGSWAILAFEGGHLTNFDVKDIYQADGQLKGHVEPPIPIKNYLGEANWYMRDSNWQADFTAAAKDIQWFLDKETGRQVDGVIGVNLAVAKAVLGVTGEIYVPDFKEKINKDNIYEQAEFYSETNSFAGSTQKASFLGSLGKQLFEQIKTLSADKRLQLVKAVIEMLQENEIQVALNDKTAAGIMAEAGWNGAIYNGKCPTTGSGRAQNCFADYLYIVESNFGVNKANFFLKRSIDRVVDISPGAIGRVVKINYENTAKNSNWPGGDYKNYLRVYIPASSNLAEVSITDSRGGKTIIPTGELSIAQIKGKKEVGFLATVKAGEKKTVEVRYTDQIDLSKSNSFSYLDYVQKQSGYGQTLVTTLVSIPEGWQPMGVEPMAQLVNGKLLFSLYLEGDIKMGVELGK